MLCFVLFLFLLSYTKLKFRGTQFRYSETNISLIVRPQDTNNRNECTCLFNSLCSLSSRILIYRKWPILGLQPRDKAAMLVVKTKESFLLNLHQNRVHFPAERNAFVLDHQHGRRDVTCKPAITAELRSTFTCKFSHVNQGINSRDFEQ